MGLLDKFRRTAAPAPVAYPAELGAPAKGTVVPMDRIRDEVFSSGVLGMCCGVDPEEGEIFAPVDGKITQVADTLHAIGIVAGEMELLIHVGVDTVEMDGEGFSGKVKLGQFVKRGDLLLTVDLEKIRDAGHPTTVILAVTNTDDFTSVSAIASGEVAPGDGLLRVER